MPSQLIRGEIPIGVCSPWKGAPPIKNLSPKNAQVAGDKNFIYKEVAKNVETLTQNRTT